MAKVKSQTIASNVFYLIHPQHRAKGNPKKSCWTITEPEEVASFRFALQQGWLIATLGWGLHMVDGTPQFLGLAAPDHTRKLMLAKFVDGSSDDHWHGYPADHERHRQDLPPVSILQNWLTNRVLTTRQIRNIQLGMPCKP